MTTWHFLEPLDVLFLRSNRLFGDAGSYGESVVPPWPSTAAGAIRSHMLVRDGVDLVAFGRGEVAHPELGTPQDPGPFFLQAFHLARIIGDKADVLFPLPADLVVSGESPGERDIARMRPVRVHSMLKTSAVLDCLSVLPQEQRRKVLPGMWLSNRGFSDYLQGEVPSGNDLVDAADLWKIDERTGIGLDREKRSADDGRLFTVQAVAMKHRVGFVAGIGGVQAELSGMLRFGGDGRAASIRPLSYEPPRVTAADVLSEGRCRIVLTAPGVFPEGWRLPGMSEDGEFNLAGINGKVVSASVPRGEVISGWDFVRRCPKPAQRVAPSGSVYWIEDLRGSEDALESLLVSGLWSDSCMDRHRQVEGFNRFVLARF